MNSSIRKLTIVLSVMGFGFIVFYLASTSVIMSIIYAFTIGPMFGIMAAVVNGEKMKENEAGWQCPMCGVNLLDDKEITIPFQEESIECVTLKCPNDCDLSGWLLGKRTSKEEFDGTDN